MSASDYVADLAEEMRRGKVTVLNALTQNKDLVFADRKYASYFDFGVPIFDFGGLDHLMPTDITPANIVLHQQELMKKKQLRLPFDACIFAFDGPSKELPTLGHMRNIFLLSQNTETNELTIMVFVAFKIISEWKWTMSSYNLTGFIDEDGDVRRRGGHFPDWPVQSPEDQEVMAAWGKTLIAIYLLQNTKRDVIPNSDNVQSVNRGRLRGKLQPIRDAIKISLNPKPVITNPPTPHADGSPKSPHDRRGFWREYKSGKRIWVDSMKINGGAKAAQVYSVK